MNNKEVQMKFVNTYTILIAILLCAVCDRRLDRSLQKVGVLKMVNCVLLLRSITLGISVSKACFRTTYVVQEYHIDGILDDVERLYLCV